MSFEARLKTLYYFEVATDIITPVEQILACRDPKDDMYLDLAVSVSAKAIVTGDKDLLSLHLFRNIPVLNAAEFLSKFSTTR